MSEYNTNPEQQDSAFYVDTDTQVVWEREGNPFYVLRCGEMRIMARRHADDEPEILRYTDDLESWGIKTDEDLEAWSSKGDEYFAWINNSWFEVGHSEIGDFYSDVIDTIDEAIAWAEWANENPEEALDNGGDQYTILGN